MRRLLIAGNWKMHKGPDATADFIKGLSQSFGKLPGTVDILICPPFISIPAALNDDWAPNGLLVGAQNLYFEDEGAYTGEISAGMLKEIGTTYVIIGHSERREYFSETDRTVNLKMKKACEYDLIPIICVGESLQQRKADKHIQIVTKQVQSALNDVNRKDISETVIAYEPVWAIGTGETATPDQAQEMHLVIRKEISKLYDDEIAREIRIIYGGSMKPHNADELLGQEDVDGGLIGGASLNIDSFGSIIEIGVRLSS